MQEEGDSGSSLVMDSLDGGWSSSTGTVKDGTPVGISVVPNELLKDVLPWRRYASTVYAFC